MTPRKAIAAFDAALLVAVLAVYLGNVRFDFGPLARRGMTVRRHVVEKAPLLVLSAASSTMTLAAQGDVVGSLEAVPFAMRLQNAAAAMATETDARVNLATLLLKKGDAVGAEEQLLEALRIDPASVSARRKLDALLNPEDGPGVNRR